MPLNTPGIYAYIFIISPASMTTIILVAICCCHISPRTASSTVSTGGGFKANKKELSWVSVGHTSSMATRETRGNSVNSGRGTTVSLSTVPNVLHAERPASARLDSISSNTSSLPGPSNFQQFSANHDYMHEDDGF